jgi:hypothetical protein
MRDEAIKAYVVVREGREVTVEQLIAWCASRLRSSGFLSWWKSAASYPGRPSARSRSICFGSSTNSPLRRLDLKAPVATRRSHVKQIQRNVNATQI